MSESEDIDYVREEEFAQVVFDDVKCCYSFNKPVECLFTLNDLLKPDASDWIGIYKVGFSNYSDHVCAVKLDLDSIKEFKGKITFSDEFLPKEDNEFYQFVYVSQGKNVRGASIPFQFKSYVPELYVDEEQDAIVIKCEINETISEIKTRCSQLTKANEVYEKLIKENEELIKSLKAEVSSIKLRCFRLTMDNEKLNFTLRNKADDLKNLSETVTNLTNENNKLQSKFDNLSNENKNLLESLQQRVDQVAQLKTELEAVRNSKGELENFVNLKESELLQLKRDKDELNRLANDLQRINEQIVKLEMQVDQRLEELQKIKIDLKNNEIIVSEQAKTIESILNEKDSLSGLVEKLTKEKSDLENSQENLSQELILSKDKLLAAEQCKEMLKIQLASATENLNDAQKKIDEHLETINSLTEKLSLYESEKLNYSQKFNELKEENKQKLEQINGTYFALKMAHSHLETRLKSSEQKRENAEKENEVHKKHIEQLELENEELKERIKAGSKEYSKLFEKYRLLKNQQFNNDMNIYHDLSSGEIHTIRKNRISSISTDENEHDSAYQDRTVSQSARASTTDIENTLLDALLGSSFYNGPWNQRELNKHSSTQLSQLTQSQTILPTTTQPKSQSQSSDLSDDGLTHNRNQLNRFQQIPIQQTQIHQTFNRENNQINRPTTSGIIKPNNTNGLACDICDHIFPTGVEQQEIDKHNTLHYGPSCPVCFLQFHKGYPQNEFENHVNSHFSN